MKKVYETPVAEKVAFMYQKQVAASNVTKNCISVWTNAGDQHCEDDPVFVQKPNT